ncbi:DUF3164 family protein [Symbiopectobacterium sp. Eva_TO]
MRRTKCAAVIHSFREETQNMHYHPEKSSLTPPPDGYRINALGHIVPVSHIKPIDLLRDELIDSLFTEARQLRRQLAEFKLRALQRIRDFVDLSAAEYGVNYGAAKGNVTLTSFDGQYRLVRAVGEHRIFDERIQAAKEKIEACITKWSDGAYSHRDRSVIRMTIDHDFASKVDH